MKKFNILKGIPANLPMINVDTDMIIPKQFLKTIKRTGLGKSLFYEMRYDENKTRVVYEPVTIEPRVTVPRIIREEGYGDRDS